MIKRLTSFDNDIDFRRLWRIGYVLSAVLVLVSAGAFIARGLNLGIDFEGGTSWDVEAPGASVADARDALRPVGADNAKIQILGSDTVRVQTEVVDEAAVDEVTAALAEFASVPESEVGISTVGPTWGDEISSKALRALLWFFVLIAAYMAIRLEWKMAAGGLLAVVHDIAITVGFYALFQAEVTPATVIAILTILGYSLYDTIIVFDKVKDNQDRPSVGQRSTYTDLMSLSLNQVLMRSINATITSLLPVMAMLFVGSFVLGAATLEEFAVALLVGLVLGAYSSIFVSAPFVAWLKEREPHYRNLRKRVEAGQSRRADAGTDGSESVSAAGGAKPSTSSSLPDIGDRVIPPRPRKQGKRR